MALVTHSVHFTDSDSTAHFRTAIPAGVGGIMAGSAYADIQFAAGSASVGAGSCIIKSVRLLSQEATDWRVEFWEKSLPTATSSSLNNWGLLGFVDLYRTPPTAQTGAIYATYYAIATLNAYIAENLEIPYRDKSAQGQLHVNLCVLGSVAKSAGDVGQVHLRVGTIAAS